MASRPGRRVAIVAGLFVVLIAIVYGVIQLFS